MYNQVQTKYKFQSSGKARFISNIADGWFVDASFPKQILMDRKCAQNKNKLVICAPGLVLQLVNMLPKHVSDNIIESRFESRLCSYFAVHCRSGLLRCMINAKIPKKIPFIHLLPHSEIQTSANHHHNSNNDTVITKYSKLGGSCLNLSEYQRTDNSSSESHRN